MEALYFYYLLGKIIYNLDMTINHKKIYHNYRSKNGTLYKVTNYFNKFSYINKYLPLHKVTPLSKNP